MNLQEEKISFLKLRQLAIKLIANRFELRSDKADNKEIIESVEQGIEFRGANLWILIFAILLASIGLNINSTAVVIGAMLISPLMGPIVGVGMGIAIFDTKLMKNGLRSLGFAAGASILASTLYFIVTPLSDAQSELLARTTPSIWDVLIAFFGGLAGIIAHSRRIKTNVVPGVAIATALMPPLCTAGFGLATFNWAYVFGALYLFFINCFFICLATILICRVMGMPYHHTVDERVRIRTRRAMIALIVVVTLPSIFLAYRIVRYSVELKNAQAFVERELNSEEIQVIDKKFLLDQDPPEILITLIGKTFSDEQIRNLQQKLTLYDLPQVQLKLRQTLSDTTAQNLGALKTEILKDFYQKNEEALRSKESQISILEAEVLRLKANQLPDEALFHEVKAQYDDLIEVSFAKGTMHRSAGTANDSTLLVYAKFRNALQINERKRLENWLKARTGAQEVIIYATR
jgi:uncharacterized hydrophobic protein (TIGR00271 family)